VSDVVDGGPVEAVSGEAGGEAQSVVFTGLGELTDAISLLSEQIQAHHARAEARERVIDRLHADVERLRAGEQGVVLRPVVTDLQNLRGDLLRQVRTLPPEISRDQVAGLLESFALSVELTLERCGSVPIRPEVGAKFSAREHRAVKVVEASREEEDGTIAEVVADGYQDSRTERIVAARVHVRRWTAQEKNLNEQELEGSTDV
jgi:molecular chaperone GrpE